MNISLISFMFSISRFRMSLCSCPCWSVQSIKREFSIYYRHMVVILFYNISRLAKLSVKPTNVSTAFMSAYRCSCEE